MKKGMLILLYATLMAVVTTLALAAETTGGVLHRGNGGEPDSLNIHLAQGLNSHNILFDLYEGLLTFDAQGQTVPGVAISHRVNAAHTQWDFTLRNDARWSDGSSVTAADFIRAWQRAIDPSTAAPYRHLFDNLMDGGQLQVVSDHPQHLSITLQQADAGLLQKLVLPVFYPLPATTTTDLPISNGAFYLLQRDINERIILHKNPHFHAANSVRLDAVHYWVTENQHSELLRFRAGELDLTEAIPDSQIDWIRNHLPNALHIAPYYGTFFLGLNTTHPKLNDLALRQALRLSIDRQILVEKVLKSGQLPAVKIIPPEPNTAAAAATHDPLFDLNQARQWLQDSAFNPATDRLEILYNNSENQQKVALAVAAMWRQNLGIRSQLRNQEWKTFIITRKGPNKQVFRSGWIADYDDPLNFLDLFHSQSHFNFYGFNEPAYDRLIERLRQQAGPSAPLRQQAEHLLATQVPVIPLYHYVSRHLVQPHILGYQDNKMDRHLSRYLSKTD
ncbi:peptide ABC transporter substrate-binding protein [Marinicella meishanensis]|uniref:peptide ABC transporter substrate-binding protein n=1 Tax=Marinicella meishanensis TaxID=2873263 RepID=UPI001CBFC337|nr:peptide ABC transporter substrate-binding protein [Marinicella sp. NBU2979]